MGVEMAGWSYIVSRTSRLITSMRGNCCEIEESGVGGRNTTSAYRKIVTSEGSSVAETKSKKKLRVRRSRHAPAVANSKAFSTPACWSWYPCQPASVHDRNSRFHAICGISCEGAIGFGSVDTATLFHNPVCLGCAVSSRDAGFGR